MLYGLPVTISKVEDLSTLWDIMAESGGMIRILVDNPDQITFLEEFESRRSTPRKWSAFVKIDGGQKYVWFLYRLLDLTTPPVLDVRVCRQVLRTLKRS